MKQEAPIKSSPVVANAWSISLKGRQPVRRRRDRPARPTCGRPHGVTQSISSPAVANGVVYVGSEDGNTYAFDADRPAPSLGPSPRAGSRQSMSSPAVANGTVYVGSDGNALLALDAKTGATRWFLRNVFSNHNPRRRSRMASSMSGCEDGNLYAIDATTGNALWTAPHRRQSIPPRRWRMAWSISARRTTICTPSTRRPRRACGAQPREAQSNPPRSFERQWVLRGI